MTITSPLIQQLHDHDLWYYPDLPEEITTSTHYQRAVSEGWHEWIETPLDFEATKHGYVYDLSRDMDGHPAYWLDGQWVLHDGTLVSMEDEEDAISYVGKGDFFMRFAEGFLYHTKEPLTGQPYRFLPWMRRIVAPLFGWVHEHTGYRRYQDVTVEIAKKNGKGKCVNEPVPTPDGWKKHGELQVGDKVFDRQGNICEVTFVHPREIYDRKVVFSNGDVSFCSKEHEWVTESLNWHLPYFDTGEQPTFTEGCMYCGEKAEAKGLCQKHYVRQKTTGSPTRIIKSRGYKTGNYYPLSAKETQQIEHSLTTSQGALNHRIPMHNGLQCDHKDLPIDPWLLGLWLGDGCRGSGGITVGKQDYEYEKQEIESLGYEVSALKPDRVYTVYGLRKQLRLQNVLFDKHIPSDYLRASFEQRLALLQGLMDSDGTISKRGTDITFVQKSKVLADQVCELLSSLGLKYSIKHKDHTCTNSPNGPKECKAYQIQFAAFRDEHPVFRIPRKLERMRYRKDLEMSTGRSRHVHIASVETVEPFEGNCISVSSPDGTYLSGKTMIPTHNSAIMSVISLFCMYAEGMPKAYVYSCACDRNQARIIYEEARNYVNGSPELRDVIDVIDSRSRLVHQASASFYAVLASDAHRNDGIDSYTTLIDEIHRHKNRGLYTVMKRAGRARPQKMLATITTYGPSLTDGSIWAELHMEAKAILEGKRPNAWRHLVFIASAEPIPVILMQPAKAGDTRLKVRRLEQPLESGTITFDLSEITGDADQKVDVVVQEAPRFGTWVDVEPLPCDLPIFSEATANNEWRSDHAIKRANPAVGQIFPVSEIRKDIEEARSPEAEAETKQLSLNIVSGSGRKWISSAAWQSLASMQVQPGRLVSDNRHCFGGLDLSFSNDLTAFSLAFPNWPDGSNHESVANPRLDLMTWAWVPSFGIEEREEKEKFPYRYYSTQDYLLPGKGPVRICEGSTIDYAQVVEDIKEIIKFFQLRCVAFDPRYAQFVRAPLEEAGVLMVEHRQGPVGMAPACKRFSELVYKGILAHGDNPVLNRAVEGAQLAPPNRDGLTYVVKTGSLSRIDPLVSGVMATHFACDTPEGVGGAFVSVWG